MPNYCIYHGWKEYVAGECVDCREGKPSTTGKKMPDTEAPKAAPDTQPIGLPRTQLLALMAASVYSLPNGHSLDHGIRVAVDTAESILAEAERRGK